MKKLVMAAMFALGGIVGVEAAPTDTVTKADLQALLTRLSQLEAQNKAQAERIQKLEAAQATKLAVASTVAVPSFAPACDTTTNETGRIWTTGNGKKYYLADASARIFEPLTESGLQFTPYGYLVLEGVYSDRALNCDWSADFVSPGGRQGNYTTLSMQDSILGLQFMTPEAMSGWKFSGKAEFDLAGGNQNDYAFHWRHLYVDAAHESGWSILFGQTWHLWKIVSPSEIDGAWMENAGHPYRRSPQIRVTKRWDWDDSSFEARVGILKGGPGMGGDRDSDKIEDNTASTWMLFETALVYDHDMPWQNKQDALQTQRALIGFGGMYGQDRSHRLTSWAGDFGGQEDNYDSYMGLIAAGIPFWHFMLQGQIFAGQDLGGVQAGCGQCVSYNSLNARGNAVRTIGGFIDLGYQMTEDWSFALGYGFDDPVSSDVEGGYGTDGITYNDRVYVDAFYRITSNFRLGLEYAHLMTEYADVYGRDPGDVGKFGANRVQFSAYFDF